MPYEPLKRISPHKFSLIGINLSVAICTILAFLPFGFWVNNFWETILLPLLKKKSEILSFKLCEIQTEYFYCMKEFYFWKYGFVFFFLFDGS